MLTKEQQSLNAYIQERREDIAFLRKIKFERVKINTLSASVNFGIVLCVCVAVLVK